MHLPTCRQEGYVDSMKVGLAQITVVSGNLGTNLQAARDAIQELSFRGADVIVLPETLDLGWCCERASTLASPNQILTTFSDWAREFAVFLVFGYTDLVAGMATNSSAFIDPEGEVLGRHTKINELDFAQEIYSVGAEVSVLETAFGRVAIPICADAFSQDVFASIIHQKAEYILSPCAWAVPPHFDNDATPYGQEWLDAYSAAACYGIAVVAVSNVGKIAGGPWNAYPVIGASLAQDKHGKVIARGSYGIAENQIVDI